MENKPTRTVSIRHPHSGQFCTLAEYAAARPTYYLHQRDTPEAAARRLDEDRQTLLRLRQLADLIVGLSLPRATGVLANGLTLTERGAWYGDEPDEAVKIASTTLAENERLAALWSATSYEIKD